VCNQYYCALSGQNKTILFNINNTTNTWQLKRFRVSYYKV
jgi:hypothetical protein